MGLLQYDLSLHPFLNEDMGPHSDLTERSSLSFDVFRASQNVDHQTVFKTMLNEYILVFLYVGQCDKHTVTN